jgi:hypothetical protein
MTTWMINIRFEVVMVTSTKMAECWVVALCNLVEVHWHFRGTCCLHYHCVLMMEAASTSEMLITFYQTILCCNPGDSHLNNHEPVPCVCLQHPTIWLNSILKKSDEKTIKKNLILLFRSTNQLWYSHNCWSFHLFLTKTVLQHFFNHPFKFKGMSESTNPSFKYGFHYKSYWQHLPIKVFWEWNMQVATHVTLP